MSRFSKSICLMAAVVIVLACAHAWAQQSTKRLIMKDGSYQVATKWEVAGNRLRYFSAERYVWEEVPADLVDWPATDKYNKDRDTERIETIKEVAKEDAADDLDSPTVAPGMRLPNTGGVLLLDTFRGQPQLVELVQDGGEVNKHTTRNILRAAINPLDLASSQTIELPGEHARVQSHVAQPEIFLNVDQTDSSIPAFTQKPSEKEEQPNRYGIVRVEKEKKKGIRVVAKLNIAVYGKVSQKENWLQVVSTPVGNWTKITPAEPLPPGEYAVVELLDKKRINLFVWDFGVDPAAPANATAWTPRQPDKNPAGTNDAPALGKRPK